MNVPSTVTTRALNGKEFLGILTLLYELLCSLLCINVSEMQPKYKG